MFLLRARRRWRIITNAQIVEDRVAADYLLPVPGRYVTAATPDDDAQLALEK
jgi:hypothetical protein